MTKTVKITTGFEFYPDGTEAGKIIFLVGAEPSLDDVVAERFVSDGLAEFSAPETKKRAVIAPAIPAPVIADVSEEK